MVEKIRKSQEEEIIQVLEREGFKELIDRRPTPTNADLLYGYLNNLLSAFSAISAVK